MRSNQLKPNHVAPPGPSKLIDHPRLAELWSYWSAKRGARPAPRRSDILPHEMVRLLPHLTLVERDAAGRFRYRLMGSAIVEAYGVDGRARYLDEILPEPLLGITRRNLSAVLGVARPVLARTRHLSPANVPYVATRLLLPITDERDCPSMVLVGHEFARDEEWIQAFTDTYFAAGLDEFEVL